MSDGRWERELIRVFASAGYAPIRGLASGGGTDRELPDIFVGDGEYIFAIELKTRTVPDGESALYGPRDDLADLRYFADKFRAEPLVCVRWKGAKEWFFTYPEEFETTEESFKWYYGDHEDWLNLDDLPGEFDTDV